MIPIYPLNVFWETQQCPKSGIHVNHTWTHLGVRYDCPGVWPRAQIVLRGQNCNCPCGGCDPNWGAAQNHCGVRANGCRE